jgi:NAD(P)H-flavin reductase
VRVAHIQRVTPWSSVVSLDLGSAPFRVAAGQAVMLGLSPRSMKPYSVASSPDLARRERLVELLIGMDANGRFAPHLADLAVGNRVTLKGPFGRFSLPTPLRPRRLLFIAGGTGIAPLRSMMYAALGRPNPPDIALAYSARSHDGFAFEAELKQLSRRGRVRTLFTVTRDAGPTWKGRTGRIQPAWLKRMLRGEPTICCVCGPPTFVSDMTAMLEALGVPPGRIRREQY